jgi:hypothetical protein
MLTILTYWICVMDKLSFVYGEDDSKLSYSLTYIPAEPR